jgi:hypothetical protein
MVNVSLGSRLESSAMVTIIVWIDASPSPQVSVPLAVI